MLLVLGLVEKQCFRNHLMKPVCSRSFSHNHHNRFTALFPGPPRWTGASRELLDFMVQGKINRGRRTDHPAGCHSIRTDQCPPLPSPHIFYRPDALPAAQPTASKHWRQLAHCSLSHNCKNNADLLSGRIRTRWSLHMTLSLSVVSLLQLLGMQNANMWMTAVSNAHTSLSVCVLWWYSSLI